MTMPPVGHRRRHTLAATGSVPWPTAARRSRMWAAGGLLLLGLWLSGLAMAHESVDQNREQHTQANVHQGKATSVSNPEKEAPEAAPGTTDENLRDISAVLTEQYGIEVVGIRSTAAGYMLDFRYKVLDPAKAAGLFREGTKPYLIDQRSDVHVGVPAPAKVGALRTSYRSFGEVTPGQQCFIIFANPARYIKPGNKVTVVLDDVKITDLVVK